MVGAKRCLLLKGKKIKRKSPHPSHEARDEDFCADWKLLKQPFSSLTRQNKKVKTQFLTEENAIIKEDYRETPSLHLTIEVALLGIKPVLLT